MPKAEGRERLERARRQSGRGRGDLDGRDPTDRIRRLRGLLERERFTQSDVAPTMLELVGVAPSKLEGTLGRPIDLITGK